MVQEQAPKIPGFLCRRLVMRADVLLSKVARPFGIWGASLDPGRNKRALVHSSLAYK